MLTDAGRKDVFPLGIHVVMLTLPPLRFVGYFGQDEAGIHRLHRNGS